MKLGHREKNLLIFLIIGLVVFCSYFFGFRNLMAKNETLSAEVAKLEEKRNNLNNMKSKVDGYIKDTEDYNEKIEEMYDMFDSGASQEYTVKFLQAIEEKTVTSWIKSGTLSQPEQIYAFGNITSSNPTTLGAQVYQNSNIGYAMKTTVSFEASYEDFKTVVSYILHNNFKCTLESLSVSYNAEDDLVSGSFTLTQFSIVGADREWGGAHIDNDFFGTENIFQSSIFDPEVQGEENGNDILSDYDLFLSLQSFETDSPALKLGFKSDASKTIINEDNDVKDVTIKFTGEEGNYKVSYKVGNVTYPTTDYAEGAEFMPGVKLSLLINSGNRTSVNDVSGANVILINESDMTLFIKVINDDEGDPRFNVVDKQGDIIIFQ